MNPVLLQKLGKFLDSHIFIDILEEYQTQNVFDQQFLLKEKLAILLKTALFDKIEQTAKELKLNDFIKTIGEFKNNYQKELQQHEQTMENTQGLKEFLNSLKAAKQNKFSKAILQQFGFQTTFLKPLIQQSKYHYDEGRYEQSLQLLNTIQPYFEEDQSITLNLLWGKLNCEVVLKKLDDVKETLISIRQKVEEDDNKYCKGNYHALVNHRAYLLHAALVVLIKFGNDRGDLEMFLELVNQEKMLGTIQMICPYFIRYTATSILRAKYLNINSDIKKFMKVVKDSSDQYSDVWTKYLVEVQTDFDFAQSKNTIIQLAKDTDNDIFLQKRSKVLIENSKHLFFENYCRLYNFVTIQNVAEFLGSSQEEAEIWIVNLIKNVNIEAKIDSDKGQIFIARNTQNFNEKMTLKLRDLIPRTNLLCNNLKKL